MHLRMMLKREIVVLGTPAQLCVSERLLSGLHHLGCRVMVLGHVN